MYIDTHCHLDYPSLADDFTALLEKSAMEDVTGFLVAGVKPDGWARQRSLSAAYPEVGWTAGLHPVYASTLADDHFEHAMKRLRTCLAGPHHACGVGEIGLDKVFAPKASLARQKLYFRRQLELACEHDMPCVFHIVGAHGPALAIMKEVGLPLAGGMVHSFSGSAETGEEYLRLGLHLSINARQANRMNDKLRQTLLRMPVSRLMIESDAPDQSPNGHEVNDPRAIKVAADSINEVLGLKPETILRKSTENCIALFQHDGWVT